MTNLKSILPMRQAPVRASGPRYGPMLLVALALAAPPSLLAAERRIEVLGSLALVSDYVQRGLSQNSERPALQAGLGLRHERGYFGQLWLSSLDPRDLAPDFADSVGVEVNVLAGYGRPLGRQWFLDFSLGRYESFGTRQILDYDYTELRASARFRSWLTLQATYTPKVADHRRSDAKLEGPRRSYELVVERPLSGSLTAYGGVGYNDIDAVSEVTHCYWSLGVGMQRGPWSAALGIIGTDGAARDRFIDGRADTRLVVTLIRHLQLR